MLFLQTRPSWENNILASCSGYIGIYTHKHLYIMRASKHNGYFISFAGHRLLGLKIIYIEESHRHALSDLLSSAARAVGRDFLAVQCARGHRHTLWVAFFFIYHRGPQPVSYRARNKFISHVRGAEAIVFPVRNSTVSILETMIVRWWSDRVGKNKNCQKKNNTYERCRVTARIGWTKPRWKCPSVSITNRICSRFVCVVFEVHSSR